MITEQNEPLDLVWGCDAIAVVIHRTPRQTFNLLETNQIPAKKVGNRWVASRGKLKKLFDIEDAA
ncbi:DNA-binding protein [Mesorhizobium sp.]|uniref:DNA-binding protein n=1 Tax=Mesorhizobium sp. TaxID=1871066 RepID=UPI00338ED6E6